jgi:hypothetical protein
MSVLKVDFSNRKTDHRTLVLGVLEPGQSYIHDHTSLKTPFSIWLATRRNRMGRQFKYSVDEEDGTPLPEGWYRIFI